MKDFSVQIATDAEFRTVRDVLVDRGVPVYSVTKRATGIDDYRMLGWSGGEVCRCMSKHDNHYETALEFLAALAAPNAKEKAALREKIKAVEAQLVVLNDELAALS